MSEVQKSLLSLLKSSLHCFNWILRKFRVSYNELMKLVSQEVSTLSPTMTVVNGEKRASWPVFNLFELWLYDVQNYWYSVLVVIPYHSLVSVGCISHHDAVLFWSKLRWVVILPELVHLVFLHLLIFDPLRDRHFHASISYDAILRRPIFFLLLLDRWSELDDSILYLA